MEFIKKVMFENSVEKTIVHEQNIKDTENEVISSQEMILDARQRRITKKT